MKESSEYQAQREELLKAETELMHQQERVAELRRKLPPGRTVSNYKFEEGPENLGAGDSPIRAVHLADLFSAPDRALIAYHMMYGKEQTKPCPMCTSFVDVLDAITPHLEQEADVVVIAAAPPAEFRVHARTRHWNHVRLLSCGNNSFKFDLGSEDREGHQDSTVSVFSLDADGTPRHFYSAHPHMTDGIKERGLDLLNPIWNYLDLTPKGRGSFYAKLEYPHKHKRAA